MAKKHKKTDLEILEEDLKEAKIEEIRLAKQREKKARQRARKKKKLSKLNAKNSNTNEGDKLTGNTKKEPSTVKRDAKGRLLPGNLPIGAKKWLPGQSGNPSGRPKKSYLDDLALDYLSSTINDFTKKKKHGRPRKDVAGRILIKHLFRQAIAGKKGIAQLLLERVGGKPKQEIDAKVENTTPVTPEQRAARIKELLAKMD